MRKKILLFVLNGEVQVKHREYKFEQEKLNNTVTMCNGSMSWGFKDSCDLIVLDCENKNIEEWAKKDNIRLERFGVKEVKVDVTTNESDDVDVANEIKKILDDTNTEIKEYSLPKVRDVPVGKYQDPFGVVYEKKVGPKFTKDFAAALVKYGFAAFTKIE